MARLRYNGLATGAAGSTATLTLGASLTNSATSVTFSAALTHSNGTAVPTIVSPDVIPLSILDANGHVSEIVYLTAYTAAATTGTISRGQESTTGVAHSSGDKVIQGGTVFDVVGETTWTNPTLTNSWVTFGGSYPTPGYRKDAAGRVHLRGVVKSGTTALAAFTLPAGYRPTAKLSYHTLSPGGADQLDVNTDGTVVPQVTSNIYIGFDGVSFFTD